MFSNGLLGQIRSAQIADHGSAMLRLREVTLAVCCDATLTYLRALRCVQLKIAQGLGQPRLMWGCSVVGQKCLRCLMF